MHGTVHGHSAEASDEARAEADPHAVAAAGDQAPADVDVGARRPPQPGGRRESAARRGPDRGAPGRRSPAASRKGRRAGRQATEDKTDPWDDADYEYFFGDYLDDGYRPRAPQEVKELPPIENTLSTSSSLTDHLEWQLSLQTDDADDPRHRRSHHRQPRRRRLPGRVGRRNRLDGSVAGRRGRAGAAPDPELRSDRRRRPRPAGMPARCRSSTCTSKARRRRRSSASTCGCCTTTRCRSWRASSA